MVFFCILALLSLKIFWIQFLCSSVHFINLGYSTSCYVWICSTNIDGNVCRNLYFTVSDCICINLIISVNLNISARFFTVLSKRKTVDGIWFLILIAYVYTADTCLNLLRCVQVYEPVEFEGKRVSIHILVGLSTYENSNH